MNHLAVISVYIVPTNTVGVGMNPLFCILAQPLCINWTKVQQSLAIDLL